LRREDGAGSLRALRSKIVVRRWIRRDHAKHHALIDDLDGLGWRAFVWERLTIYNSSPARCAGVARDWQPPRHRRSDEGGAAFVQQGKRAFCRRARRVDLRGTIASPRPRSDSS
jgi:hypothetical protein